MYTLLAYIWPAFSCPAFFCLAFFARPLGQHQLIFKGFARPFEPKRYFQPIIKQTKRINISKSMIMVQRKKLNSRKQLNYINTIDT